MLEYNKNLKPFSQKLRREATETEQILWAHLRKEQVLGVRFYRQKPIGNYIVDFYCPKAKLVIEIDGSQHFEEECEKHDKKRDEYLKLKNLTVLRLTNLDIFNNLDSVMDVIYKKVKYNSPPL